MASLRTNVLANYAGQAWMILMGLAFVPFYIRILGIESFGLISFMLSLQAMSQLLDLGIGGAVNRELARRSYQLNGAQDMRDLVRSFECLIWSVTLLIALSLWLASTWITSHWLHAERLGASETIRAVAMMGIAIAAFWPTGFYGSALSGLEQQTSLNLVNAVFVTLRAVGVIPIILLISATASAFIAWHAVIGVLHSVVLALLLWQKLPASGRRGMPRLPALHEVWRFAGGLFAINVFAVGVSQFDKLALSAMRPLEEMGYYGLAASISAGLGRLVVPVFNALYPRFSRLVATGRHEQVSELFHLSSQYLAVVVAAVAAVLIFFSRDVLYLWTGDAILADRAALPLALLSAGGALNGMMNVPYALQLAHGWTRLAMAANAFALVLMVPVGYWAVSRYGMVGAATLWLAVNLGYFIITAPITMRRLLPGESRHWYLHDALLPMLAALGVAWALHAMTGAVPHTTVGLLLLVAISLATFASAATSSGATRQLARWWLSGFLTKPD